MKKVIVMFLFVVLSLGLISSLSVDYYSLYEKYQKSLSGHVIDYKFKNENGYLYKRKYDFTDNKWIDSWRRV